MMFVDTADESFTITAHVEDQMATQPGMTITYTNNGTMSGTTFYPYTAGSQTVTVGWGTQTIDVTIDVVGGA